MEVFLEQAQLPRYEVCILGIASPHGGVHNVKAGVDERPYVHDLVKGERGRLRLGRDGEWKSLGASRRREGLQA